ncbi:hypothetical protein H4582DRAFT_2033051, partial [Lactarius indigo]
MLILVPSLFSLQVNLSTQHSADTYNHPWKSFEQLCIRRLEHFDVIILVHSSPVINAPLSPPSCYSTVLITLPPVKRLCTFHSILASGSLVLNAGPANLDPKIAFYLPFSFKFGAGVSLATSQSLIPSPQGYLLVLYISSSLDQTPGPICCSELSEFTLCFSSHLGTFLLP